jgi:hypothetical protein
MGHDAEETRLLTLHDPGGSVKDVGSEPGIGIDEKQEFSVCLVSELLAGPRFSSPARRKWFAPYPADTLIIRGIPLRDPWSAVGGLVVEDGDAEGRVCLGQERIQASRKWLRLISRRYQHLNVWLVVRGGWSFVFQPPEVAKISQQEHEGVRQRGKYQDVECRAEGSFH